MRTTFANRWGAGILAPLLVLWAGPCSAPAAEAPAEPAAAPKAEPPSAPPATPAPSDPRAAEVLRLFQEGLALRQKGHDAEAAETFGKAAALAKAALGPEHLDTGHLLMQQGDALLAKQPAEAAKLFAAALPILKRHLPPEHTLVTYTVNELACAYDHSGRSEQALELNLENLKVREAALGEDHPHTLISLYNAGSTCCRLARWPEAARLLEDCLQRIERRQGEPLAFMPRLLFDLGQANYGMVRLAEAEKYFTAVVHLGPIQPAADENFRGASLVNLIAVCGHGSPPRIEAARQYMEQLTAWARRQPVPDERRIAGGQRALGVAEQKAGNAESAVRLFEDAVRIIDRVGDDENSPYGSINCRLDGIPSYLALGRSAEAETLCLSALDRIAEALRRSHSSAKAIMQFAPTAMARVCLQTGHRELCQQQLEKLLLSAETHWGKDHREYAYVLLQVGEAFASMADYARAKPALQQCVEILRGHPNDDDLLAIALHSCGNRCIHSADYAEAETYLTECIALRRKRYGDDHLLLTEPLVDVGFACHRLQRFADAEKAYQEARRIAVKIAPDGPEFAHVALFQGRLYTQLGRCPEAEELLLQSLAITERLEGPESANAATGHRDLGFLCRCTGRKAEAEEHYRRALKILEKTQGRDHPDVASLLSDFSDLLRAQGRDDESKKLLDRSQTIYHATTGGSQRDRLATLNRSVLEAARRGDAPSAVRLSGELRRLSRRWLRSVLPAVEPDGWLAYLAPDQWWGLSRSLTVGKRFASHYPAAEGSAEWLLNEKAMGAELLADQVRQARRSHDPAVAKLAAELREVREHLSHMVAGSTSGNDELLTLRRRERGLSRQMGLLTREAVADDDWYQLSDLQKIIPPDAVLIDVARFYPWLFDKAGEAEFGPAEYAAWVVPPLGKGAVRLIPLGPAAAIDSCVGRCRQTLEMFRDLMRHNPRAMQANDPTPLETARLAELVWKPLAAAVGPARQLIISPDGALWLFPWEALPLSASRFLVEDKQIHYVTSARDLLERPAEPATGGVIFCDPDYNYLPPAARAPSGSQDWMIRLKQQQVVRGLMVGARFDRAPDAAHETTALAGCLEKYLHAAPAVYTQREAREETFKQLSPPRVLVVCTHGFFRDVPVADRLPSSLPGSAPAPLDVRREMADSRNPMRSFIHPLLRCGVALTGANLHARGSTGDDGLLLGMEVLDVDLRGTELVVLLACQSGLGAINDGEGVAGLHQAFRLAGARTVLASLWSIPVLPSNELVEAFLANLPDSDSKSAALRAAQLRVIAKLRDKFGRAQPLYWAGLTLVGGDL